MTQNNNFAINPNTFAGPCRWSLINDKPDLLVDKIHLHIFWQNDCFS